mgnify:CR=1 FL=1|tara:strand:- start:162 stop:1202 length:1041 start_codon:yes stop_codon:yes gene_type:complete
MAIKWSWAFGTETPTVLEQMTWDFQNLSNGAESTTQTYTYVGSPARQSMSLDDIFFANLFRVPTEAWSPQGWLSAAIYIDLNAGAGTDSNTILSVLGGGSARAIYIRSTNIGTNTFSLFVDNTFKENFTLLPNRWNYIGLQYDMSTNPWSGRVYVDGVPVTALHTDSQSAETTGGLFCGGTTNGKHTYVAQIIAYDNTADAGETPYFVTRVDPMADTSTTPGGAAWTSTAADNHSALESPFNAASYVNNDPTAGGNDVIVSTTNLATQLGTSPTTVAAVTVHTWATGSGVTGRTELSDDNAAYTVGNTITPSVNPTYSYATDTTLPSSPGTPWGSASNIFYKYEVI